MHDDEKPLDPAMLHVQAKMRRLMLIAGLTLGLGIIVVFAAILYRITAATDREAVLVAWRPGDAIPTLSRADMGLPTGARLVFAASDGRRLILTYEYPGGSALIFVDAATLKVTGRLNLAGE